MIERTLAVLDNYGLLESAQVRQAYLTILCPLHQEKTPSCGIDLDREMFYCQGCSRGGSLIDLVAALEKVNKLQAMRVIHRIQQGLQSAGEVGVKLVIPQREPINSEEARTRAKSFFFSLPRAPWDAISTHYLLKRGFERRTLKHFDVRINQSAEFPIIFPVFEAGKFQGYMTRALDNRPDKYRMSTGMRKSEVLIGHATHGRTVLLVEGFLDAARAWQNGYHDTVSSLNWALSDVQLEKLSHASAVICGLDNDEAGERGYVAVKENLEATGIPVVRWPFPSWIKDHGELERYEFQAGLRIALRRLHELRPAA